MNRNNILVLITIFIFTMLLCTSCEDDTSRVGYLSHVWLELSAEVQDGIAPDTVTFTGTLHGYIDTLTMCYPRAYSTCFVWSRCIRYSVCDSTQEAKRTYTFSHVFESSGEHRAMMHPSCRNYFIDSDTIYFDLD